MYADTKTINSDKLHLDIYFIPNHNLSELIIEWSLTVKYEVPVIILLQIKQQWGGYYSGKSPTAVFY